MDSAEEAVEIIKTEFALFKDKLEKALDAVDEKLLDSVDKSLLEEAEEED